MPDLKEVEGRDGKTRISRRVNTFGFIRYALCFSAGVTTLAGCALPFGSASSNPVPPATSAVRRAADPASTGPLLYATALGSQYDRYVYVMTYPGLKPVQRLGSFYQPAVSACGDRAGNVYVLVGNHNNIYIYTHGAKKPTRLLVAPAIPYRCSVNPKTGDLAVVGLPYSGADRLFIYRKAAGTYKGYHDHLNFYDCAYDDSGNLYLDGFPGHGHHLPNYLVRFADGSFTTIMLNEQIRLAKLQWDRGVLVDTSFPEPLWQNVYWIKPGASNATVVRTIRLERPNNEIHKLQLGDWIQGGSLIAPGLGNHYPAPGSGHHFGAIDVFRYPEGGKAVKSAQLSLAKPYNSLVVSSAP